jgi:hypothetical protein
VKRALILAAAVLGVAAAAAAAPGAGLYGLVIRAPTQPVCSADSSCSEPAGNVVLRFVRGTVVIARTRTDADGRYRVRLSAGGYVVRVGTTSALGNRIEPRAVRVRSAWRRQNFAIDTGIR